ncbi:MULTISPECIES: flagellar hook-associated protein FlgK [unclassified Bosea (in: a-proteobacteria)]|uniref:flagellar hook-associated protein FlgK n=1 Tax=unclassified Bosea (in: a-proteobacteria) TaxID=2653178 RepID=UPI000F7535F4|nr:MULTISPECIES: flagellar hook-associated protein FlgK [unclassified Bosea (in: a-proteobacteria)]AZO76562.1 flagellar hook-associated protein FlgK [Bosea sp. Tri-49]RXT21393.1 flagellar hook-associated protein FlgK [Bosea sp. Tri-39]RXT31732.1 flagellar hook-associated protein FlgK [Bosea sp. Tri-54]
MGLNTALGTAISGLNSSQIGIGVVSQNVANAGTPGYVRRNVSSVDSISGGTVGVSNPNVQRLLDRIVQHQLLQESSGAAYTSTRAQVFANLDQLYGAPGSKTALDSMYSSFTSSLQALQNDPSSYTNRTAVLDAASQLASRLRGLSEGVQQQRSQAEAGIGAGVTRVNELLDQLTNVNARIVNAQQTSGTADLRDQRDRIVSELSQYVEIRTDERPNGSLSITTASGTQLFDGRPTVKFEFDARANIGPQSQWSSDPAQRGVGTIVARDLNGNGFDAIANNTFRSGEIGALVELRDKTLVQAQKQLDEIAAQLSSALSDREIAGTAVTAGAATGFDVDLAGLQSGNSVTLDYKVTPGGQTQRFTFVRVESAASLPLPASAQGDANNRVIGIDFSGGPASVAAQMQAAIGPGFTVSNTGSVLRIVDDGAGATRDVVGLTSRPTQTSLTGGTGELPFFVDGRNNGVYTGSYEGGAQSAGFASRITVNPDLIADRSRLVVFNTSPATPQGDTTRPKFLLDRLTSSQRSFTNATGFDGSTATSTGTISSLVQRVVAGQGQASEQAKRLDEGQQVAFSAVQSRFLEDTKVNVDQEMSTLIELQSAYAANARVISTVKELLDVLLRL